MGKGARSTRSTRTPTSTPEKVRVTFTLDEAVVDRLDRQADDRMVSPSLIVGRALDRYLSELEADPGPLG